MSWPGQRRAQLEAERQLKLAREAVAAAYATNDRIYLDIARVHIRTARNFRRNSWKQKR